MGENTVHDERVTHLIRKIARILSAIIIGFGVIIFVAEIFEAFSSEFDPYP